MTTKRCPRCGCDRATSDYHVCVARRDGLGGYCRYCAADLARERRVKQGRDRVRCPGCHRYFLPQAEATCCSADCAAKWEYHMADVLLEVRRYEALELPERCACGRALEGDTDLLGRTLETCGHCHSVARPRCTV